MSIGPLPPYIAAAVGSERTIPYDSFSSIGLVTVENSVSKTLSVHRLILANKRRNCYSHPMAVRACKVTYRDAQGVEHTVQVTAQSLFEAVAQALRVFREHDWSGEPVGSASV